MMIKSFFFQSSSQSLFQGSGCGSTATAATRPSALPVQTLNTGSMEQSGKELRIMILFMLMEMSSSQVSTKGE